MALNDREPFVGVRRMTQSYDRANSNKTRHSNSDVVAGSAAWLGKGLSCVCVQGTESDARLSFDLTPDQFPALQQYVQEDLHLASED